MKGREAGHNYELAETCHAVLARSVQLRKNRSGDDNQIPGVDGAGSLGRWRV
ncbi:MAG: hypothetical protein NZ807_06635 [Dehalococcoidia bacterium]|nr:hypothetical protein [Dehalococcoidia bacterium]